MRFKINYKNHYVIAHTIQALKLFTRESYINVTDTESGRTYNPEAVKALIKSLERK